MRGKWYYKPMTPGYSVSDAQVDGVPVKELRANASELEARFAPGVGMIGCSLRHRGEELLGQRGGLAKYRSAMSTMGIPLLYPWANRLSGFQYDAGGKRVDIDPKSPLLHLDDNGLPIHGLLAASPYWEIRAADADDARATLRAELDFGAHQDLLAAFPFPHQLAMEVELRAATLSITTTITAGSEPVPIAFGFHPYLQLPGVERRAWRLSLPVTRRLLLDEKMIPNGETEPFSYSPGPLGDRVFDDGFDQMSEPPRFTLAGGGRQIVVDYERGFPKAQVFAPPGNDLICFEPMTAITNALVHGGDQLPWVKAGQSFAARFSITVT